MTAVLILSPIILLAAFAAAWMARPVHAALMLAVSLIATAVLYLAIRADFIGLVQLMVYVGAVAVLIVFSLLITRRRDEAAEAALRPLALLQGIACTIPLLAVLAYVVLRWSSANPPADAPAIDIKALGNMLFTDYAPAVIAVAVMLTSVMIGAALFAREAGKKPGTPHRP